MADLVEVRVIGDRPAGGKMCSDGETVTVTAGEASMLCGVGHAERVKGKVKATVGKPSDLASGRSSSPSGGDD